jgi:hypothetical protein
MLEEWFERHEDSRPFLVNAYGPSECTVHSSFYQIKKEVILNKKSIIGYPFHNAEIYIFDKNFQHVPYNVIGEIFIGGKTIAKGYFHRQELTECKFLNVLFNGIQKRLYKSGDLGRYLHDGSIEYLGRIDYQVKINGFRIELGEIEAQIFSTNIIEEVIVVPFGPINNQRLAAYIVLKNKRLPLNEKDQDSITQDIVNQIKQFLPKFMLPSSFMFLSEFKRNENGKINRNLLPEPNYFYIEKSFNRIVIPPKNNVEIKVVKILSKLLNIKFEDISLTDNIFNLGINSIMVIQFVNQLNLLLNGIYLSVRNTFEKPSIGLLSEFISKICNVASTTNLSGKLISIIFKSIVY